MTVVIYTHPPDYLMAGISARMLAERQGLKVVLAIDEGHGPFACEYAKVVRTGFARKGNLNGLEFVQGHLRLMAEEATGEYTIKLDSDTVLRSARKLVAGRTEVAVGLYVRGMSGMNGCCYALRTEALAAMLAASEELSGRAWLLEDQTVGRLAQRVGPVHFQQWGGVTDYDRWRQGMDARGKAVVCFEAQAETNRREVARRMRKMYEG